MTTATGVPWAAAGVALLQRCEDLPADPRSARVARRLVRDVLAGAQREEWRDAAELAVTELVTNAVLHAHTTVRLNIALYADRVGVQVGDDNPVLPVFHSPDAGSSTGRGLGLVATLSLECGMQSRGQVGKVMWFTIGDGEPRDGPWLVDADAAAAPLEATVVLQQLPTTLWLSARHHHDALLRELALSALGTTVDFAAVDHARHLVSDSVLSAVDAAHREGRTRPVLPDWHPSPLPWVPEDLDLALAVQPAEAAGFLALQDVLDLAERLAVSGDLLMLPGLPEIVAVRDWACEQVVAQLAGIPPSPWRGTSDERFETETHAREVPEEPAWDAAIVRESTRGVVAADDANRIIAISEPLALALGWRPDDLVGRRVVTLIPPSLREAHVAGFSRHLTTGEAHVLGVPLELPVLHADGRELTCDFLIQRLAAGAGRAVYLAWIEPQEPPPA